MKQKSPVLVLVPLLLMASCIEDENSQRDVYQSKAECVEDWGKPELCEPVPEKEATSYHSGGSSFFFWGPGYYSGNRGVLYNGTAINPTTSRAVGKPFVVSPQASTAAKSTPKGVTSISRGGFGSTAKGLSGGS